MFDLRSSVISLVLALVILLSLAAYPDDNSSCSECGEPAFPEAQDLLEEQGYPANEYTVLMMWQEVSRDGTGHMITGLRVMPIDDDEPFDLYSSADGSLLSDSQLKQYGIPKKNWNPKPVEQFGETALTPAYGASVKPTIKPMSSALQKSTLELSPIDLQKVLDEDSKMQDSLGKGVKRTGVFRVIEDPIVVSTASSTAGKWQTLQDGSALWSMVIHSPEAVGQRIHFSELDLPPGASVIVYNADIPNEAYGPYTGTYPGESDLWSATCFGERVAIECYVPTDAVAGTMALTIDKIIHVYEDFASLQWGKIAGSCNLDVGCTDSRWPDDQTAPEWTETSYAIGAQSFIATPGSLRCTGTLVADTDESTEIPYFLTANHCLGNQREASTIEVYWLYQRPDCDSSVPGVLTVPRTTGGADYLASSYYASGNDFAFMRLREQPPDNLSYLGWSSEDPGLGTEVTCIHHPSGDYKRITFGATTDAGSPSGGGLHSQPLSRYHEVAWHHGTTEPGSSGSTLMITETRQLIGQLWGGGASCALLDEPDYYGKFNLTFPLVSDWLSPPLQTASLTVTILPQEAVDAGAQWNVDGGLWQNSGATVTELEPGNHTVSFRDDVVGWSPPSDKIMPLLAGDSGSTNGTYTQIDYDFDINDDGIVNAVDVQLVINAALGLDSEYDTDVNNDGVTNASDVQLVINAALGL